MKRTVKKTNENLNNDFTEESSVEMRSMEEKKSIKNYSPAHYVLVALLVVAAYFLGNLKTKLDYLEKGTGTTGGTNAANGNTQPTSKYKNIDEVIIATAKAVGLDGDKIVKCANSGSKKQVVDADLNEGTSLGVNGTPGFFINGRFLGGAFPYTAFKEIIDKELAGTATDDPKDYSASLAQAATSGQFDPKPKKITTGNAYKKGTENAKIVIVEYSDFQCPFCKQANPTLEQVMSEYQGKVQLVFKDYPLSFHPFAEKTAHAARCAGDEGKFWEFHDQLFLTQDEWSSTPAS